MVFVYGVCVVHAPGGAQPRVAAWAAVAHVAATKADSKIRLRKRDLRMSTLPRDGGEPLRRPAPPTTYSRSKRECIENVEKLPSFRREDDLAGHSLTLQGPRGA